MVIKQEAGHGLYKTLISVKQKKPYYSLQEREKKKQKSDF